MDTDYCDNCQTETDTEEMIFTPVSATCMKCFNTPAVIANS